MNRDLDILKLLLDPCLTTDEAAREAAARTHTATIISEMRSSHEGRKNRPANVPATDGPAVGF